jgi:hypothetical protein
MGLSDLAVIDREGRSRAAAALVAEALKVEGVNDLLAVFQRIITPVCRQRGFAYSFVLAPNWDEATGPPPGYHTVHEGSFPG